MAELGKCLGKSHSGAEALVRSLGFSRIQASPEEWRLQLRQIERQLLG